ncbi:F-box associated interaction domain-containing protein [Artemisia annua]|uniref:F-box associated interaction domain-containing protein n=1 Tax=Artemisia annua TaxID=35608 RepID=A0A2U1MA08_ARTAN|nr:F-box associated interaction domain-containing protein [Artemisia annua]
MASENIITIPHDIITDILHRLPAKSLGQFRCVSKNWLSLLSQPKFIKTYRNILKRNHLIFISLDHALYSVPVDNHEAVSRPTKLDISAYYGSCNVTAACFLQVLEWCKVFRKGKTKVVSDRVGGVPAMVKFLKSNTWRQVSDSPYGLDYGKLFTGVYVNGFLHWIANNGSHAIIVAFSLADEKFSEVASPSLSNEDDIMMSDIDCKLVSVGEKLAIFVKIRGEIWLMNEYGVKESWTKIVVHGLNEIPLVEPVIFYDNGKILFVTCDLMVIYDVKEHTLCKSVDVSWNKRILEVRGTYVESLVSPKLGRTN